MSDPTFSTNTFASDLTDKDSPAYSRLSIVPAIGFARFVFAPIIDIQTSLAKWESDNTFNIARQQNVGAKMSFSMHCNSKSFFLGGSFSYFMQDLLNGNADQATLEDETLFDEFKTENSASYQTYTGSIGMGYVLKIN